MSNNAIPIREPIASDEIRRVVRRAHGLRTLGLALGAVMIGSVLYGLDAPVSVWILLVLHGLAWPHVVRMIVQRSDQPVVADQRCFMVDTAMGGVWIVLMQFNLLPSVVLVTTYSMSLIAVGGGKRLVRGLGLMTLTCAVAALAGGLAFAPATGVTEIIGSIPLLVLFPATLSIILYRLTQRVRRQNHLLMKMSRIDCLSGLLNRRSWEEAVNAALRRRVDTAALLLIDIDHFKRVNDQCGHTAGDEVVRQLGVIIRGVLRNNDLAGRYGGDEFGILLDGADAVAAERVAERIREGVACSLLERVPGMHCTVSIGIAQGRAGFGSAADWVKAADAAMYRAKLAGRNGFAVAS